MGSGEKAQVLDVLCGIAVQVASGDPQSSPAKQSAHTPGGVIPHPSVPPELEDSAPVVDELPPSLDELCPTSPEPELEPEPLPIPSEASPAVDEPELVSPTGGPDVVVSAPVAAVAPAVESSPPSPGSQPSEATTRSRGA